MTGRTLLHAVVVFVLLLSNGALPSAQTRPETPVDAAAQALKLGRFDEVERLLGDQREPRAIAIRARADIARGRYQEAEKLLAPAATSAPTSDAALELGLLQQYLGRRAEAGRTLNRILDTLQPRTADDLTRLALAAKALGEYQDANGFFREANRARPDDPIVNTAWGELFLDKYELNEARKSFDVALGADENNPAAIIGMARIAAEGNPPAADQLVERAIGVNANYVPAHLLKAQRALDDRERDEAKQAIGKALAINPNSLEARALDAALDLIEDRPADYERKAAEVLKINPVYSEVYRVAGEQIARNYRFEEALVQTRRAIALNPSPKAHADLGLQLLRIGDEAGARAALETSLEGDPFNSSLVTKNLLTMLDKVDTFVTIRDGDLVMKFAPEEAAVMREQALPLAKEAIEALSKRWDFRPQGPLLIEMFPVHDDFAVRTLGLPGLINVLGVCFGKVVALDSPAARPPGSYNWQPTLWHELAHVITLQMSNNRLPKWLSEGISQWEERRARPEWGREMEVSFAQAMDADRLLKLENLNEGFSDPKFASLAYYQASLAVQHFAERFGEPALRALVRSYARGISDEQAIKEAFNQTWEQLQASFDAKVEKDYAALRAALQRPRVNNQAELSLDDVKSLATANPGSFPTQVALGRRLAEAGDLPGAIAAFERASALVPLATGDDNPNRMIAAIAIKQGDTARAIRALQEVMKVDHADVDSARQLAGLVAPQNDPARAADAYGRVVAVAPFDASAQTGLGRALLARRDVPGALAALRSALAANPPDKAAAHTDLAEAYLAANQPDEAKKQTLAALEIAPSYERAQDLLLKVVGDN